MSNPTTPFGWQMPTPTDLVTNLPADFEVFGQAVATSMGDLLGGTTGQVLAKASNADMDFVWSADAAGMTNPMTTTGDTIYSSPGSTPVRLGIGSTGQVLTVASGIPSWATPATPSSGLTLIAANTFSGSSAVNVSSCFSSSYDNYLVFFKITSASAAGYMNIRMRNSGGDEASSVYYWSLMSNASSYPAYDGNYSNGASTGWNSLYSDTTDKGVNLTYEIKNPYSSSEYTSQNYRAIYTRSGGYSAQHHGGGSMTVTTSYTGFSIIPPSGTITGGYKVYGYSN
jgi:hypothetical protein